MLTGIPIYDYWHTLISMVNYRRNYVPGASYFFTVTLHDRRSDYLIRYVDLLRQSIRDIRSKKPFEIDAIVILPEHLHTIWRLPENDSDFSGRWKAIKSKFTRLVKQYDASLVPNLKGEYDLWQKRFWEHTIQNQIDYQKHVDYIHYNPIKHGMVKQLNDWPYSSFHRFVMQGILSADWGNEVIDNGEKYGE